MLDAIDATLDRTDDIERAWRRALEPSNPPTALAWIEQNFRLNAGDSAAPGLIALDPWQREVLQAFDDPRVRRIVVAASSQVGKTAIGLALASYSAHHRQGRSLYVTENDTAALNFARERVRPALDANAADIMETRAAGSGNRVGSYSFRNGSALNVVGANAPSGISSRPALTIIATEVRGFPISAGKNGDPLSLMLARTKSFGARSKAFVESSPGIKGRCRLTEEYMLGDARRYHLPCPHCGHAAPVSFYPEADCHAVSYDRKNPEAGCIVCAHCAAPWSPQDRLTAIRAGSFRATKTADDPTVVSFRYSELESPRSTIGSVCQRYVNARGNPERLQAFDNTVLGIEHDPDTAAVTIDEDAIQARAEHFDGAVMLPAEVLLITAGVDVQPDRLECHVLGHGESSRRWSVDYRIFQGDTLGPSVWVQLEQFLLTRAYNHPAGKSIGIHSAFVDSSDGNSTQVVYEWSANQQMKNRKFYAIKGREGERPIVTKSRNTKISKTNPYKLIIVGTDTAKSEIFAAINNDPDAFENRLFFPDVFKPEFFKQIAAEKAVLTTDERGVLKRRYVKVDRSTRNEALDTLVYALAAFHNISPAPDFKRLGTTLHEYTRAKTSNPFEGLQSTGLF